MKKIFALSLLASLLMWISPLQAQEDVVRMDNTTNGTTVSMADYGGSLTIRDDDSQGDGAPESGSPMRGIDVTLTVEGTCEGNDIHLCVYVSELSLHCLDTLYIYDGADTNAPLLKKFNNVFGGVSQGDYVFASPNNTTGKLTFRLVTDDLSKTSRTNSSCYKNRGDVGRGFTLVMSCKKPCEEIYPVIDSMFYRTRNDVIYDSAFIHEVEVYDTIYNDPDDHSQGYHHIDTNHFLGANLCIGDGVIFRGHGEYTQRYGYYTPSDATSYFIWDMANDNDTIQGIGVTEITYKDYQRTGCYDLTLDIIDAFGCETGVYTSIKVRTATNPIKTIFTLSDICNNKRLPVNMGYDGENATLTLKKIETNQPVSKVYEAVTFIPDGCNCAQGDYFEAPVTFTEFPNNRRINSAKDICSICINMEHSYMGDIYISIVCPTNQEALLKFGNPSNCSPSGIPARPSEDPTYQAPNNHGGEHGGSTYFGWPTEDGRESSCTNPWENPYGGGMDYCFSRNSDYILISGENAGDVWDNTTYRPAGDFYIGENHANLNTLSTSLCPGQATIPANYVDPDGVSHSWGQYANMTPSVLPGTTRKPSDHENKLDYYLPYTTFQELVGCPLNGDWKVRVYDRWGADNGWIFNWSMDICNVTQDNDCKYEVGIDSLIWRPKPDSIYHDYDLGHYRGLIVEQATPTLSYISSPDTAGHFPIDVFIYDEFGCVWDTATRITTYWSPEPHLGSDTSLCGVDQTVLDARDRHSYDTLEHYTYLWEPYGENTPTITTSTHAHGDINYVVRVSNEREQSLCVSYDTIKVGLRTQPMPNFLPTPFTLEGCAPMTLTFNNHSVDADRHLWVFGDGITSELESPTHTYAEGNYTLKYYAISDEGCIDSVVSEGGISVYPTPQAAFSWDPVYPSVLNPVVTFQNNTVPHSSSNHYFWEIQYNRDNPLSVDTRTDTNAIFDFSQYVSSDEVAGVYGVTLIARTDNLAPSGNYIYCSDTASNTILVINDFLQFPNVVTPNGDGINDRFVIQNLIGGMGYPINSLDIYNKWGARVYHKENISSDEDFWDPSDEPSGTYFYRFSARGYNGNIEHNGSIEVIK